MEKERVIVLHSGGLDSTLCLLMAIDEGYEPISLGINYNQRHIIETQYAYAQCNELQVQRKLINVSWDKPIRKIPLNRSVEQIKSGVSTAFLEGRNILFLSLASAEAAGLNAIQIWMGVNALDFSGYPDCSPEFIDAFQKMQDIGFPNGPKIKTPLINMTKPEIAQKALELGIRKGDTWSCYRPKVSSDGIKPCHECDACILHDYAWENLKEEKERTPVFTSLNFR